MTPSVLDNTPDGQEELLAQLRDLVPSAFLDGDLDRDALVAALGLDGESKPSFNFTWPGIDQARKDARTPTTATLVPDADASLHWPNAEDVLIEGDNLQVLKLLKNGYSRAVKLIYIDRPTTPATPSRTTTTSRFLSGSTWKRPDRSTTKATPPPAASSLAVASTHRG